MMYASPKFESEEAARSQVEKRLQNQLRLILRHGNCSNGQTLRQARVVPLQTSRAWE